MQFRPVYPRLQSESLTERSKYSENIQTTFHNSTVNLDPAKHPNVSSQTSLSMLTTPNPVFPHSSYNRPLCFLCRCVWGGAGGPVTSHHSDSHSQRSVSTHSGIVIPVHALCIPKTWTFATIHTMLSLCYGTRLQ